MVKAPPVVGSTTPPLLYSLFQYHDSPLLAVSRYDHRGCLPTLLSLSWDICIITSLVHFRTPPTTCSAHSAGTH